MIMNPIGLLTYSTNESILTSVAIFRYQKGARIGVFLLCGAVEFARQCISLIQQLEAKLY